MVTASAKRVARTTCVARWSRGGLRQGIRRTIKPRSGPVPLSGLVESADRPMLRPILKLSSERSPTSHPLGSQQSPTVKRYRPSYGARLLGELPRPLRRGGDPVGLRTNGTTPERIHIVCVPALPVVLAFTSDLHNTHVGLSPRNSLAAQQLGVFNVLTRQRQRNMFKSGCVP
jgi:hypothetical protein